MDEETKKAIKVGKQILGGRRTDNIEQQRKISKELLKYWKKCCNGKPLTISEQVIMHDIELRGYKDKIDYMERKFRQFFVENVLLLVAILVLIVYIFTKNI